MRMTIVKTSSKLSNDSKSILKVFTDTVNKLTKLVEDAKASISYQEEQIAEVESEKSNLEKIVISNENIISKINAIWNNL